LNELLHVNPEIRSGDADEQLIAQLADFGRAGVGHEQKFVALFLVDFAHGGDGGEHAVVNGDGAAVAETAGVVDRRGGIVFIVELFQFEQMLLAAHGDAAGCIDFVYRHIDAVEHILTVFSGRAAQRSRKADHDVLRPRDKRPGHDETNNRYHNHALPMLHFSLLLILIVST